MTGKPRGAAEAVAGVLRAAKRARVKDVVLIGAGALSAYGAPRYSEDVDFLLAHADARKLVRELIDDGWKGPPPSADVYLYQLERSKTMRVDIMGATESLYEDAITSAQPAKFLGKTVRVPSPTFYVLLKLRAAEGDPERKLRHLGDIQDLLRVRRKDVDLDRVRRYVRDEEPDLAGVLGDVERALADAARHRRSR